MFQKSRLAVLIFVAAFAGIAATDAVNGVHNSSQAPAPRTGAPGELNCTSCHSGTVNSGGGSLSLTGLPANGYVPGQTYALTITVNDASQPAATRKYGFSSTALNASNAMAGTFAVTNNANTSTASATVSGASRSYIRSKSASGSNSWTFNWTAPASDVGTVSFYFSGNAANGDGGTDGDKIYTAKVDVTAETTSLEPATTAQLSVMPNPATDLVRVSLNQPATRLTLSDLQGKRLQTLENPLLTAEISLVGLPTGVYLLQAAGTDGTLTTTRVVKH